MKSDQEWLLESDKCSNSFTYLALIRRIQADALRHAADVLRSEGEISALDTLEAESNKLEDTK